jgi:hypothetical protein
MTKQLLDNHNINYEYYDLDNNSTKLLEYNDIIPKDFNKIPIIIKITGKKQIFLSGGFTELKELFGNKKTKKKTRTRTKINRITKKNTTETFCSPRHDNANTCFDKPALINIIKSWNDYYTNNNIKFNKNNESVNSLWNKINNKLKGKCDNELCWANRQFVDKDKLKPYFRPTKPQEWNSIPREWLSTININDVLKQYENKYNDYMFIGSVPIDFDDELSPGNCVINELCKVNINTLLQNNKKRIGIVFNLDKHNESGSHWVAMFCNFNKKEICYFDSYGQPAPQEINTLMIKLRDQAKKRNLNMKLKYNTVRHQYKNSECGIYCINFIVKLLEGRKFETHCNKIMNDDDMFKNRELFFI